MATTILDRKRETTEVKRALLAAGIPVKSVGHGAGTAWGWLHITIQRHTGMHTVVTPDRRIVRMTAEERNEQRVFMSCAGDCEACNDYRERDRRVLEIAQRVSGRSGEYSGRINIHQTA